MEDRRQFVRISDSLKVRYQVLRSFRLVTSHAKNFSEGGMSMPVLQRLQPGMVLELEVYFPQYKKPATATGEVIWLKEMDDLKFPYVTGLKFISIDAASLNKIRNHIRSKKDDKYVGWIE